MGLREEGGNLALIINAISGNKGHWGRSTLHQAHCANIINENGRPEQLTGLPDWGRLERYKVAIALYIVWGCQIGAIKKIYIN